MISNVSRCADGPAAVHRLSEPYLRYSPQETDVKITHALRDTEPHTCAFIQSMGYDRCPPGGCGVKAPIGLARQRPPAYDPCLGPRRQWHGVPTPIWKEAER
jgi:putative DNA primase/helicase